jgi:hypothetical protein
LLPVSQQACQAMPLLVQASDSPPGGIWLSYHQNLRLGNSPPQPEGTRNAEITQTVRNTEDQPPMVDSLIERQLDP